MKWVDALAQIPVGGTKAAPKLTNRQAAGLVQFARSTWNTFSRSNDLAPFDWYAWALPALGYFKLGDKFKVDTAHQLATYPLWPQLSQALAQMAQQLDAQGVAFRAVVDPRGTDKIYRQLAADAWKVMQQQAQGGDVSLSPVDDKPAASPVKSVPGAESPTQPTAPSSPPIAASTSPAAPRSTGKPKDLARAAVQQYAAAPDHKRWFMWALRKNDPTPIVREGATEADVADAFGALGLASSPFGDLSDVVYGAYWDTAASNVKPAAEYGGQLEVKPEADAKKKSGGGGLALLFLLLAFGSKRSKRHG